MISQTRLRNEKVPLWKRELLKRIQSKNQRMSEEKADIVEEHIPKVSDNIFLVHEKKHHHQRLPSAPPPKSFSSETSPTSPVILAVDNVIIIEKENKNAPGDNMISDSTGSIDSVFTDEVKEYPKAGLVHRLMGKFQFQVEEKKSEAKKPKNFYQRSKSAELLNTDSAVTKEPTPEPSPVVEEPKPDYTSSTEIHPRTSSMPADLLTPLLLSSAKPFKSWKTSSTADHGYHHVNVPVRKVSSSTSPKHTSPEKSVSAKISPPVSKPETVEIVLPKCESAEKKDESTDSFSDELSNLHSNRETPYTHRTTSIKPNVTASQTKSNEAPKVEKRNDLKNGETLHSSGSVNKPLPSNVNATTTVKLQDKSNFTSYRPAANTFVKNDALKYNKPEIKPIKPTFDRSKNTDIPKTVESKIPSEIIISETKEKPEDMKENRSHIASSWNREKSSEYRSNKETSEISKQPVSEAKTPVARSRETTTEKTVKIVPKPRHIYGVEKISTVNKSSNENKIEEAKAPAFQQPLVTNEIKSEKVSTSLKKQDEPNGLPRTDIDAVIITPVTSLPLSPTENKTVKLPEKETVLTKSVPPSTINTEPIVPKETTQPKNNFVTRTSTNTNAVTPKSEPVQKSSIFGPRVKKSSRSTGGGFTFTVDPSKYKRSAAQPPTAVSNDTPRETGYSRTIVPSSRSNHFEGDITGEQPKTGKRKLTVDQITVIGGYVTLEKSCLSKNKRKKEVSLKFSEYKLETTHTYESERSLLAAENPNVGTNKTVSETPGFGKDSTIGKYTPKYLLSMKSEVLDDEEDDTSESKSSSSDTNTNSSNNNSPSDAKPLTDDYATAWSDTTSGSTDILF